MNFEAIKKLPVKYVHSEDYLEVVMENPLLVLAKEYAENVELLKDELGTDMNYRYILKG